VSRIGFKGDWGSGIAVLDGEPLKDAELLHIEWPDGTVEPVRVTLVSQHGTVSDHGKEYATLRYLAYVSVWHHGIEVRVPIAGLTAWRSHANK
jgi:hypothetical protein